LASSYQVRCSRCGTFDCSVCEDGYLPHEFLVEIASWSPQSFPGFSCCTCPQLAGSSYYTEYSEFGGDPSLTCGHTNLASLCTPSPACVNSCCTGSVLIWVWLSSNNVPYVTAPGDLYDHDGTLIPVIDQPSGLRLRARVSVNWKSVIGNSGSTSHVFIGDNLLTSPVDCISFNAEPLTWIGRQNSGNDGMCDPTAGTAPALTVTSIA